MEVTNQKTKYLYNIDFVRFVLIMIIVYCHCIGTVPPITESGQEFIQMLTQKSSMAMPVALCSFFMMSGFFLYNSFLRKPDLETKDFVFKRILRLWPLLLFSFIVLLIAGRFNRMCILDIFFINAGLGLVNSGSNNPACWFICVLLVLSAFFYFIIKNFGEKYAGFFCSISAFLGYAILNSTFSVGMLYKDPVPCIPFLTMGMLLGLANISLGILVGMLVKELPNINLKLPGKLIATVLEISIFAYIGISILMQTSKITMPIYWEFYFVILFIMFVYNQGYFSKLLNNKFSKSLGACSYAIFIMQFPTIRIMNKYFSQPLSQLDTLTTFACTLACLVVGVIVHLLVENNVNKLINRKLKHD